MLLRHEFPSLDDIYDESRNIVGCLVDPFRVYMLLTKSMLAEAKYHEHFIPLVDLTLPPGHIRVVVSPTFDGYPRNKQTGATDFAAHSPHIGGGAHSPEIFWHVASADGGESTTAMHVVFARVDAAHKLLVASSSSSSSIHNKNKRARVSRDSSDETRLRHEFWRKTISFVSTSVCLRRRGLFKLWRYGEMRLLGDCVSRKP